MCVCGCKGEGRGRDEELIDEEIAEKIFKSQVKACLILF